MYLYPKWIRAWHVLNAILFIILIITGISIHYTDKESSEFITGSARNIRWHNIASVILIINYIVFIIGNILTSNGKHYRIKVKNFWSELMKQLRYYSLGMFRGEKNPFMATEEQKFNPLQRLSYVLVMYIAVPLLIISGMGMAMPGLFISDIFGINGVVLNKVIHITMGFILSIFVIIHIYTCTLGSKPASLFRGIITGYLVDDD
jgi:thiosulfate reductase cytochrome b subunit